MGLDYRYLLYFERDRLRDALEGVVEMSEDYSHPPAVVRFPVGEVSIPLAPWSSPDGTFNYDDAELRFACSLRFDEDGAIAEYIGNFRDDPESRVLTAADGTRQFAVGYIYLTVRTDLGGPAGPIRFEFGTTGTRMSLLFDESMSIRRAFIRLLECCGGICGLFDREMGDGEVFWFKGHHLSEEVPDIDMLPGEIEDLLAGS